MFGPGGVLFLLRHELLLTWRNFRASGKGRHVRRLIFYSVIVTALGFGGYWVARLLSEIEPTPSPAILGGVGAVFAVLFSFMLAQSLMLVTESLYQRGDLDLLLSSPLPAWRVLLVRMGAVAINAATLYLVLLGAVFVWLPFFGGWAWMWFAPSLFLLSLFATGLSLVVARLMFALVGPRTTRVVAQVAASLIGAAFFLGMQSQNLVPRGERARVFGEIFQRLTPIFGDASSPISLPARAALGAPDAVALWGVLAVGAYLLAVWWFARRFVANAAAIAGAEGRQRRADVRTAVTREGLRTSLVLKEWRLLLRDPLLLSQILVQLLYLLPLIFIFSRDTGSVAFDRYSIVGFCGLFTLLSASLAASLAWLTISAEDAPDLIAAAPVPRDQIDIAKAFAAGAPVIALMAAPSLAAALVSPMAGLWLFLGASMAVASVCLVSVWHQAPGNRKTFRARSRGSIWVNIGRSFLAFCWAGATALAVSGWALASILPVVVALGLLAALHESRRAVQGDQSL